MRLLKKRFYTASRTVSCWIATAPPRADLLRERLDVELHEVTVLNRLTVQPREEPSGRRSTALRAPRDHKRLDRLDERKVAVRLLRLQLVSMALDHGLSHLNLGLKHVLPAHAGR